MLSGFQTLFSVIDPADIESCYIESSSTLGNVCLHVWIRTLEGIFCFCITVSAKRMYFQCYMLIVMSHNV